LKKTKCLRPITSPFVYPTCLFSISQSIDKQQYQSRDQAAMRSSASETRKFGNPARDTIEATSPRRNSGSMPLRRHHPCHNPPDDLRLMFAKRAFQRISSFECTRPRHAHLPSVVCLRAHNQNPPLSGAIRKRMFDNRLNLRPHRGHATCVMHLYHHRHGSSIEAVPYRKHQSSASLSSLPSPQPRGPSAVGGALSGWFIGQKRGWRRSR
jgi:hypothetical protein